MIHLFFPFRARCLPSGTELPGWWNNAASALFLCVCRSAGTMARSVWRCCSLAAKVGPIYITRTMIRKRHWWVFLIVITNGQWETGFFFLLLFDFVRAPLCLSPAFISVRYPQPCWNVFPTLRVHSLVVTIWSYSVRPLNNRGRCCSCFLLWFFFFSFFWSFHKEHCYLNCCNISPLTNCIAS